jgi:hypothetical protein
MLLEFEDTLHEINLLTSDWKITAVKNEKFNVHIVVIWEIKGRCGKDYGNAFQKCYM